MLRKTAIALIVFASFPVFPTSASARPLTLEEQDAAYELCYNEYISRGYSDGRAWQDCYIRVYGDENGVPGGDTGVPEPDRRCYGSFNPDFCNVRPE